MTECVPQWEGGREFSSPRAGRHGLRAPRSGTSRALPTAMHALPTSATPPVGRRTAARTRGARRHAHPLHTLAAVVVAPLVAFLVPLLGARTLGAQAAGVVRPPPARQAPPPTVATGANGDSTRRALAARRNSLTLTQRLDIQAWVDSAAGALARGAPATTVPLTAPPPAPARPDTTPRAPRRTPVRPSAGRRPDVAAGARWVPMDGAAWTVARATATWYLRRCECLGTARPT